MTINVEMFKRIEEAIIAHPEQHYQAYFEANHSACGTTRCVAGWAIHFWGLDNGIVGPIGEIENAYVKVHGNSAITSLYLDAWEEDIDSEKVGAHILGLTPKQGYNLFFNMDEDDALRMVKEYAQGSTDVQRSPEGDEEED